jgi:hypothetical protein
MSLQELEADRMGLMTGTLPARETAYLWMERYKKALADSEAVGRALRLDPHELFGSVNCAYDHCGCEHVLMDCILAIYYDKSAFDVSGGEESIALVKDRISA